MIQEPFPFVEEEKKETEAMGRPDPDDEDAPSPPGAMALSPSKQRARAAGSAGLSELSKQLRILQAKNEAQSVEINRLERQLRILAELQGISVADLRKALEDACANEAFGELQHRVAKLRAELEAATLAKQRELRGGVDASAPHIANRKYHCGAVCGIVFFPLRTLTLSLLVLSCSGVTSRRTGRSRREAPARDPSLVRRTSTRAGPSDAIGRRECTA